MVGHQPSVDGSVDKCVFVLMSPKGRNRRTFKKPNPKTMSQSWSRTIQVNNWKYPRIIRFNGSEVALQVTLTRCNHCPTCSKRVAYIREVLEERSVETARWEFIEGAQWIIVPVPEGQTPTSFLSETLKVRLS